ncbi:MAG TPA: ferric reductase-like transmembrane domain-containing protein [Candidatus Cybelea sp.]|nr:ferric reductase-like transmembrane domain-containing protein [Candidatus Cybelea sp.]
MLHRRLVWWAAFFACLAPAALLSTRFDDPGFTANPMPEVIRSSGLWSLRILLAVLLLPRIVPALASLRRMVGLWAAAYAALHLVAWARYYRFDWVFLLDEAVMRLYLTIGSLGVLILALLAATSYDAAHRWLGTAGWRRLHLAIYPAAIAGYVHAALALRMGRNETVLYGALLAIALVWRLHRGVISSTPPAA